MDISVEVDCWQLEGVGQMGPAFHHHHHLVMVAVQLEGAGQMGPEFHLAMVVAFVVAGAVEE